MVKRKKINVLIVDDDYVARLIHKSVVQSFDQFNLHIDEAIDGAEALQLLKNKYQTENKFHDLIILDNAMPGMSGFDFIQEFISMEGSNAGSIIIVTASDNPDDADKSKAVGIKYFLTKPLTFEKLKSAILDII